MSLKNKSRKCTFLSVKAISIWLKSAVMCAKAVYFYLNILSNPKEFLVIYIHSSQNKTKPNQTIRQKPKTWKASSECYSSDGRFPGWSGRTSGESEGVLEAGLPAGSGAAYCTAHPQLQHSFGTASAQRHTAGQLRAGAGNLLLLLPHGRRSLSDVGDRAAQGGEGSLWRLPRPVVLQIPLCSLLSRLSEVLWSTRPPNSQVQHLGAFSFWSGLWVIHLMWLKVL